MNDTNRVRIAHWLTVVAAGIAVFWLLQLYPLLTHTGPAPGAGAQYVFVLIPTLAVATLVSVAAVALAGPALRRDASLRRPLTVAALASSAVLMVLLLLFWVRFAVNATS